MGQPGIAFQPLADSLEGRAAMSGQQAGRQGVLHVVVTGDPELGAVQEGLALKPDDPLAIAPGLAFGPAEPGRPSASGSVLPPLGVGGGYHAKIAGVLSFEDPQLGAPVGFHGAVARQVIGGQVQEGSTLRMEGPDRFELVAAQFQGEDHACGCSLDCFDHGGAQVAAGDGRDPGGFHKVRHQVRGGALPVGTRHCQDPAAVLPLADGSMGQLDLADNPDPPGDRLRHEGFRVGNPGADDEFAAIIQKCDWMITPYRWNTALSQIGFQCGVRTRPPVRQHDRAALRRQVPRRREPRSPCPHDHGMHAASPSRLACPGACPNMRKPCRTPGRIGDMGLSPRYNGNGSLDRTRSEHAQGHPGKHAER